MVKEQRIAPCSADACAEPFAISWESHECLQDERNFMRDNALPGESLASRGVLQDSTAFEILDGGYI